MGATRWKSDEKNAKFRRECNTIGEKVGRKMQKYKLVFRRECQYKASIQAKDAIQVGHSGESRRKMQKYSWSFRREAIQSGESRQVDAGKRVVS